MPELITQELLYRLNEIRDKLYIAAQSFYIASLATAIRQASRIQNEEEEAKAYFQWVQKNIIWEDDHSDELMQPQEIVELGRAECENQVILLGALLRSRRFPLAFKITATTDPDNMGHIHLLVGLPKREPTRWVAVDSTIPNPMGEESPHFAAYVEKI